MGRPLKISKTQALLTLTATTATTNLITVSQDINALGILPGTAFAVPSAVGGLAANTKYWILQIVSANTFTASSIDPSANATNQVLALTTTTAQSVVVSVGSLDRTYANPNGSETSTNATTYGVVGGNSGIRGSQILTNVAILQTGVGNITASTASATLTGVGTDFKNTFSNGTVVTSYDGTYLGTITNIAGANATSATFTANSAATVSSVGYTFATNEPGYIVRQKGKQKYMVQGTTSGLVGTCVTANVAAASLKPGQMSIGVTYANTSTAFAQSVNDHDLIIFGGDGTLANGSHAIATFGTAYAANTYPGQPDPIVTVSGS